MCDPVTLKGDEVMIYQDGDKIIVTELRPMSLCTRFSEVLLERIGHANLEVGMLISESDRNIYAGWIPMPIHQPESNSQDKAALYEKLRKLNPREFAELHERNLRGEGSFDDLVSRLP